MADAESGAHSRPSILQVKWRSTSTLASPAWRRASSFSPEAAAARAHVLGKQKEVRVHSLSQLSGQSSDGAASPCQLSRQDPNSLAVYNRSLDPQKMSEDVTRLRKRLQHMNRGLLNPRSKFMQVSSRRPVR
jgi:hypothetical protein